MRRVGPVELWVEGGGSGNEAPTLLLRHGPGAHVPPEQVWRLIEATGGLSRQG